ncbi:hypothetical protein Tco_0568144 [Tanacetum coccineum]
MLVAYTTKGRWDVRTLIEDLNCIQSREIKACISRFLSNHIIKLLATNPDILVRAVQDQIQKQFEVGFSKVKAFRAKRFATDKMTGSQILTTVRVDANNEIYPVAYAIVEAESKASWYSFNPIFNRNCPHGLIQAIASVFLSAEHRKWELTEIQCKHDMAAIYNMTENSLRVGIPEQWVHAAYRLET